MGKQEIALWLQYASILTLSVVCFFLAALPLKRAAKVLNELFVMYRIFNAESIHGSEKASNRLYTFSCSTKELDEGAVNEIFHFLTGSALKSNLGDNDTSKRALRKVLSSYSHILLYRDKVTGTLRGTIVMGFNREKEYTVRKVGLTFFDKGYRGGPLGYFMASFYILKELALHPLTPLYIVAKVFSYKGYLVGLTVKGSYPRYNQITPEILKKIFKEHAHSVMIEGDSYDEETFVLEQERTQIDDDLLPVSEQELQDPNIRFFIERNPGYVKACSIRKYNVFKKIASKGTSP